MKPCKQALKPVPLKLRSKPKLKKASNSKRKFPPVTISSSSLEFQSSDDAWYSVRLLFHEETLTVQYCNFTDDHDDRFNAGDFKSLKEIDDFQEKFRPTSAQLQDNECWKLMEGMTICASDVFGENVVKFYDAIIETVQFKEHGYAQGEELCLCTFEVFWQNGPHVGDKTWIQIESICLLQPGDAKKDPTLASFLKISREKLGGTLDSDGLISAGDAPLCKDISCHKETPSSTQPCMALLQQTHCSTVQYTLTAPDLMPQELKSSKQSGNTTQTPKGMISKHMEMIEEDMDLGREIFPMKSVEETGEYYFILVENLERDLSPSTIADFIYKETSILPQAYVFPCLTVESYTRGIICLDSEGKLQKLQSFVHDTAHMIISSRGRPWVITEKILKRGSFGVAFGGLIPKSENNSLNRSAKSDELKVVLCETEEYKKGKRLRELFIEYQNHMLLLHNHLASEERKILQPSDTICEGNNNQRRMFFLTL